ncbi:MAG: hypothetical protein H6550_03610 [Chitinophagales bacterium]|nr:hypothetical protein [Chitinophagales bacterium]
MKNKWYSWFVSLSIIVVLSACGDAQNETKDNAGEKQEISRPAFLMQQLNVAGAGTTATAAGIEFGVMRPKARFCDPGAGICEITTGISSRGSTMRDTIFIDKPGFIQMKINLDSISSFNSEFKDSLIKIANGAHSVTGDYGGVLTLAMPYTSEDATMEALGLAKPFTIDNHCPILATWVNNDPTTNCVTLTPIGALNNQVISVDFIDVMGEGHCRAVSIGYNDDNTINPGHCTIHTNLQRPATDTIDMYIEVFMNINNIDSLGTDTRRLFPDAITAIDYYQFTVDNILTMDDPVLAKKLSVPLGWQTLPGSGISTMSYNDGWISMMLHFVNPNRPISTDD